MPRIPPTRTLTPLKLAAAPCFSPSRPYFAVARALSTTCAARADDAGWVRSKLWKGTAPGPADPYTQRATAEKTSNLPDEALELQAKPEAELLPRPQSASLAPRRRRLTLPPKRTEAKVEKEVKSLDPSYVPAMDIEGLEEIPVLKKWWDQPGHWGPESEFKGFASVERVTASAVIEVYLRQAVVETLALKQTRRLHEMALRAWRLDGTEALRRAMGIEIRVESGELRLAGDVDSLANSIHPLPKAGEPPVVHRAEEAVQAEDQETVGKKVRAPLTADAGLPQPISLEEAEQMVETWGEGWKTASLDDQSKFAVRKRLYQLTGVYIADSRLGASKSIRDVLAFATQDPKPVKLAEVLRRQNTLQQLSNVTVHNRRVGPIDKEMAIGRWKVIEEELKKRNLPVRGTLGLTGSKERDWLTGRV